ncbi:NAD(P)/FAD-dependent oxidoreductase [Roseibium sp. MMSF_3544]|uniref:protoporphyrinogen/coproporphyrinogen oxidase n=1 Tax=unclassified Roseibium TaxID=2629323 RepID=UPI00273F85AE|nr:FAD-dependent oxidoreductase [Roseibium sp. MMSF_3544]
MKIVIAGAGLAGLAAGVWLKDAGHQVEIYEASSRAGGRALTLKAPDTDDIVDVGTQYFHSNYRRALALIKRVGLDGELSKVKGRTRFFDDRVKAGSFTTGHKLPYIAAGSLMANLVMTLKGAFRCASNWIDPYAVLADTPIDRIPAGKAVPEPFEWEFGARALIAAGALVEPEASSVSYLHLIRLMRIVVMTDYLTLNNGVASLHRRLAEELDIHYNSPVEKLVVDRDCIKGVRFADGPERVADHTIIATPPAEAANILPEDWSHERAFLTSIKHPPAIVVTLFLNHPLEEGTWSYVFRPSPHRLVSFCVDASQKNEKMMQSKNAALQAWICSPASEELLALDDSEILNRVLREISEEFSLRSQNLLHVHVHKVPNAVPLMDVGHNERALKFLQQINQRPGIDLCGDYLSGGYMECALWSAEQAVKRFVPDG